MPEIASLTDRAALVLVALIDGETLTRREMRQLLLLELLEVGRIPEGLVSLIMEEP